MRRQTRVRGRFLSALALLVALGGCASLEQAQREEQRQDLAAATQSCATRGWSHGTPGFAACVQVQQTAASARRRANVDALPRPTRIEPESGQLCVPTASGLNPTC